MRRVLALGAFIFAIAAHAAEEESAVPAADAAHGKQIFQTICAHCHNTTHETSAVGAPGLAGVTKRRSLDWIEHWITNPEKFAASDPTAKKLIQSNPTGLVMPAYPEMQDPQNRRDVIEFLKTLQ